MHWAYDSLKKTFAVILRQYLRQVPRDGVVLDVGCGTGELSRFVTKCIDARVIGVDIDPIALSVAQSRVRGFSEDGLFVLFDGYHLPLAEGAFVLAFAHEVIEHVGNPGAFLEELWRILTPGGWLIVTTPNGNLDPLSQHSHPGHVRHYAPETLWEILDSNSFTVKEVCFRYHTIAASIDRTLRWLALRLLKVDQVQPHMVIFDDADQAAALRVVLRMYRWLIDPLVTLAERVEFHLKRRKEGANIIAICRKA